MANSKKDLIRSAENLIEDIFDHYDDYCVSDKQKVQQLMNQMASLNLALDSYDKPKQVAKSKNIFEIFKKAVGDFFGKE